MIEFLSLRNILQNFAQLKLATTSEVVQNASSYNYQILCVVTAKDEIILRYSSDTGEIILKKIDFFCEKKKIIKGKNGNVFKIFRLVISLLSFF